MLMSNQNQTVFVHNLNFSENEASIASYFGAAGPIVDVQVLRDTTNRSRGFAYITYRNALDAQSSVLMFNNSIFNGRKIIVQFIDNSNRLKEEIDEQRYKYITKKLDDIIDLLGTDRSRNTKRTRQTMRQVVPSFYKEPSVYSKPQNPYFNLIPIGQTWLVETRTKNTLIFNGKKIIVEASNVDKDNQETHYPHFLFNGINEIQNGNRWATSSHQKSAYIFIQFSEPVLANILIMTSRNGNDCLQAPSSFEVFGIGRFGIKNSLRRFDNVKWSPNLTQYFTLNNSTEYTSFKIMFYSSDFPSKYFGLAELNLGTFVKNKSDDDECLIS